MGANAIADPAPGIAPAGGSPVLAPARVPWYLWTGVLAVASAVIGVEWDISWHQSIGRDTFWTPAHMLIYLCGVLTGVVCAYLVLSTTFGGSPEVRAHSVTVFGFHSPVGVFLATWGGLAMLVSAPFDDWWHSAYGLDVQLFSPPHLLLLAGLNMIAIGFLLLIGGALNRGSESPLVDSARLRILFLVLGGLIVHLQLFVISQRVDRGVLHSAPPYKNLAVLVLPWFAILSQAGRSRWAITCAASIYTSIRLVAILILPLFAATPRLGPVYTPVTHFIPDQFPILLLAPAVALDLLWRRMAQTNLGRQALAGGVVFMATLVAAEWPFVNFLLSRGAQNRFFGVLYTGFATAPVDRIPHLTFVQTAPHLAVGLLVATGYAIAASWIGLHAGRWMSTVRR